MVLKDSVAHILQLETRIPRNFLISLSGGADSVCLFLALCQLRETFPIQLTAFHYNYQLRGEASEEDEAYCKRLGEQYGVPVFVAKPRTALKKFSQEKGRLLRHEASKRILPEAEFVEGHHMDDMIEGFLFRLFRGSGSRGLSGLETRSQRDGRVVWRPLLSFRKADLLKYLESQGESFREDASNFETTYDRNWIRHEILPRLESRFPHAVTSMKRLMMQNREDETYFRREAQLWLKKHLSLQGLPWAALVSLPRPHRLRVIREWTEGQYRLSLAHREWQSLQAWVEAPEARGINAAGDLVFRRQQGAEGQFWLSLQAANSDDKQRP